MNLRDKHLDKIVKYSGIFEFEQFLRFSRLSKNEKAILKLRISQINKCDFCENYHAKELRDLGDSKFRIHSIREWRETNCFTESEKTILGIAEEITLNDLKLSEGLLPAASEVLDKASLCQIITIILVTSFWNKFFVGTQDLLAVETVMSLRP